MSAPPPETGPTGGRPVSGAVLATRGFWMPRMRPETVTLVPSRTARLSFAWAGSASILDRSSTVAAP